LYVRLDAIEYLEPGRIFGVPQLDINNTSFGRITTATGARSFICQCSRELLEVEDRIEFVSHGSKAPVIRVFERYAEKKGRS
jgi:hypothetical protein